MSFIDLYLGLCALFVTPALIHFVLWMPRLIPIRLAMARTKYKMAVHLIPFSPTATVALFGKLGVFSTPGLPVNFGVLSLALESIFTASLAGVWLTLPSDPAKPIGAGPAIFLTCCYWLANAAVFGLVAVYL